MKTEPRRITRPTGPGATAEAIPTPEHPDAELLRLKREIENASNTGNTAATDKEAAPYFNLASKLRHELAEIPAHTLDGISAKFDDYQHIHEGGATSVWDEGLLRTIREALERLKPSADAKLFALEAELKEAHKGLSASVAVVDNTDEDHQPWYDRIMAADQAAEATPAQTAAGVLAKLRMAIHYEAKTAEGTDGTGDDLMRSAVKDAERIGAAEVVYPDAELRDLWSQHQALCGAWPADATDEESDRHGNRINQVELQIAATPANSMAGVAVKLQVAAIDVSSADDVPCALNVMSARDDAMRLAGIGGAP